jgi:hypothetical protein
VVAAHLIAERTGSADLLTSANSAYVHGMGVVLLVSGVAALAAAPDDAVCLGGAVLALLRSGRLTEATPLLKRLSAVEPRTESWINRLVYSGGLDQETGRTALCLLTSESNVVIP